MPAHRPRLVAPVPDGPFAVVLAGEVDLARRRQLTALVAAFRASSGRDAVVDVSDVEFADSELLTFLARLHEVASCRGGRVRLRGASPAVRRLLGAVGLDFVVSVEDDPAPGGPGLRLVRS